MVAGHGTTGIASRFYAGVPGWEAKMGTGKMDAV